MAGRRALGGWLGAALLAAASAAHPETVTYDNAAHPLLAAETAKGENARVVSTDGSPRFFITRIVVDGESPERWTEAFEIVNTLRRDEPRTPAKWLEKYRESADKTCTGEWKVIAESADSLTFSRETPACPPHEAQSALYRVLYGKPNVFTLIATRMGGMTGETRSAWLAVLASAAIEK